MPKLKFLYLQSLFIARAFSAKSFNPPSSATATSTSTATTCIATNSNTIKKSSAMTSTSTTNITNNTNNITNTKKRILFLRHGQAMHNPRAEAAKDEGCSHQTFLDLMQQDDAFDAPLTPLGIQQAIQARMEYYKRLEKVQLVVSSPLSRALHTADLAIHPLNDVDIDIDTKTNTNTNINTNTNTMRGATNRICMEEFREINGWLLNSQRRPTKDLISTFHPSWNFHLLTPQDDAWTTTLESEHSCAERCYQGLLFLLKKRVEDRILTVAHGGLLRFVMVHHPNVVVVDGRSEEKKRFGNCELREYDVEWTTCINTEILEQQQKGQDKGKGKDKDQQQQQEITNTVIVTEERPLIIMTEIH